MITNTKDGKMTKSLEPRYAVCRHCQKDHKLMVNMEDVASWQAGEYIQDAMPYLSAGERELLISGTCDDCWEKMFGECE